MALLDHARRESHWIDNPEGAFTTTLTDLATDYRTPLDRVRESLGALVASGWLDASPDVAVVDDEDDVTFRVAKYLSFNYPQGSDADRKAHQRLREADNARDEAIGKTCDEQGNVTPCHDPSGGSLEREEEREEEKTNMSNNATQLSDRAEQIQNVFEYWTRTELETGGLGSTGKGRRPKLTKERRAKINARLGEGYSAADLKMAIAFYCRDPHHLGETNGTRYTDLTTTLKNGSKVEAGIAGYEARKSGGGLSAAAAAMLREMGHTEAGAA